MADQKITELTQGTPLDTDIIPYVDLSTGTTKKATKSELKGDKGDTGDTGPTGPQGPAGVGAEVITSFGSPTSDTKVASEKLTKDSLDAKLPLAGGTMTGKYTSAGRDEVGKIYSPASGSQTVALDCSVNNIHIVNGNASGTAITFTIANATNNQPFIVSILQGSGTPSTIAGWFSTIRWANGITPTLTATLNKRDTFGFIRTGANTYDGFVIGQSC